MFEYLGWITVRETASGDADELRLRQIVDGLRPRIDRMASTCLLGDDVVQSSPPKHTCSTVMSRPLSLRHCYRAAAAP
ncbi:Imm7 family immunity protein [Streptomyces laurentii]|uniref:Imm7 family immunity protein n=1 Tax=Streptomyces laurentii TaxID=39478 RepID=UPI0036A3739D